MGASDTLNKAADLLEERGWVQNTFESITGKYCAVGAIEAALDPSRLNRYGSALYNQRLDAVYCLAEFLQLPLATDSIIYWNDRTPGISQEVVVKTMRKAAEACSSNV